MSKGVAGDHGAGVGERRREVAGWWSVGLKNRTYVSEVRSTHPWAFHFDE